MGRQRSRKDDADAQTSWASQKQPPATKKNKKKNFFVFLFSLPLFAGEDVDVYQSRSTNRQSSASVSCRRAATFFRKLTVEENLSIGLEARHDGIRQNPAGDSNCSCCFTTCAKDKIRRRCVRREATAAGHAEQLSGESLDCRLLMSPTEGSASNHKQIGPLLSCAKLK